MAWVRLSSKQYYLSTKASVSIPGVCSTLYEMGTVVSLPGYSVRVKRPGREADH
jgi:hypothetical protein